MSFAGSEFYKYPSEFLLTYTENRTDAERCHKHLQCVYTDSD